ncbi:MAG: type I glutamate--ammonia ligase [Chloroflexia bacterium]|nr:type I glutamate--ammonia ligase [Chloroflexia bacterium]
MVDLKFCDMAGRWHHVTLPSKRFGPDLLERGLGFDGSSVGLATVESGDMCLIPDLKTGFRDPFWDLPALSFICDIVEADTHQRHPLDPRGLAIRAADYMRKSGIASESRWLPELEFYLFDRVSYGTSVNRASYQLDAGEAYWNSEGGEFQNYGFQIPPHGGYHAIPPADSTYNLRAEMVEILETLNVPVKYHHHEVGGPGQYEIELGLIPLVQAADQILLAKYVIRMTAYRHGKTATFMPKPLYNEAGSGLHFHQTLRKDDQAIFYDASGYGGLSQLALSYVAGLLAHGPALLALTNPSTNSYRRLVPGFEAPVSLFFSLANRSAAIRVPKYATTPQSKRIEFRPPDATCNPYLALSAQLLAGLDGIQRQLDPTEMDFGPCDENVFDWPPERRQQIKALPASLPEALRALEQDHDFLLQGDIFSPALIDLWIESRHKEALAISIRPHPFEMDLYFDL